MFAPSRRLVGALVALVALLAGCGGSATPGASGTPQASVTGATTPSPTPEIDVAQAFAAALQGNFTAKATLSGTMRIGADAAEVGGEMRISGPDNYLRFGITRSDGASSVRERTNLAGKAYARVDDGLWMLQSDDAPGGALLASAFDVTALRDEGIDRALDGRPLHRLTAIGLEVAPAMFGLTDPSITDFSGDFWFLAEGDGTPAGMREHASWRQTVDQAPVPAELDLVVAFERVGGWVSIEAPPRAWRVRSSIELSYQMAYPVDWDVTYEAATSDTDACDLYFGPTAGEIQVYRYTDYPADASASLIFRGFADWLSSALGARIDTLDDVTVGGLQARVFRGHYTDDTANTLIFFQDAVIVGDGVTWEVQWYSAAGAEESDRLFMLDFLSTFQPGG